MSGSEQSSQEGFDFESAISIFLFFSLLYVTYDTPILLPVICNL